jgi:Phage integrase, N-terminal SAM-like domain
MTSRGRVRRESSRWEAGTILAPAQEVPDNRRPAVSATGPGTPASRPTPRLLDRLRRACRLRHYSSRTEEAYCYWVRRFVHHHGLKHPDTRSALPTWLHS